MRIAPGVSYHPFADKVYVHNIYTQKDYILGGVALDILDCCARQPGCSLQDICALLVGRYDISDLGELRRDTKDFLNELKVEKILVEADAMPKGKMRPSEINSEVEAFFSANHRLFALCLELTYRCVAKCVHCYIDDFSPQNARPELSLADYCNILVQARKMGCVRILLTGGEVLLRSDLADIAERAVSLGFIVDVYTTGLGLTDSVFDRLCGLGLNSISFSLYSGTQAEHDAITGVDGSFEKTLKAMLMFRSAGINTFIKSVALRQNIHGLESLYELGKRLKLFVSVSSQIGSGHKHKQAADYSLGCEGLYKSFFRLMANYHHISGKSSIETTGSASPRLSPPCSAGRSSMSIDPFGDTHPCTAFTESCGSVLVDSLPNIWDKMSYTQYPINVSLSELTPSCHACPYAKYCQVCPADLIRKGGYSKSCDESYIMAKAAANVYEGL